MHPNEEFVRELRHGFELYRTENGHLKIYPTFTGYHCLTRGASPGEYDDLVVYKGGEDLEVFAIKGDQIEYYHTDFWDIVGSSLTERDPAEVYDPEGGDDGTA